MLLGVELKEGSEHVIFHVFDEGASIFGLAAGVLGDRAGEAGLKDDGTIIIHIG